MTRRPRSNSATGIHHVMLRGINRQIIFEDDEDYRKFLFIMKDMVSPKDELGHPLPPRCTFYAYCLMTNHVHLLIQEKSEGLSATVKQIASRYAMHYNKKYERTGSLFQGRFKSEPVNDLNYFLTLIRYIHQNPVAGGLCEQVGTYEWSSWREYTGVVRRAPAVCSTSSVLKSITMDELDILVNEPLPKTLRILDFDKKQYSLSDEEVEEFLSSNYGLKRPGDIQLYIKSRRNEIIKAAKAYGASIRQLSRLTSISTSIIRNV